MKSYSFYFNASDWLASPSVKMMSKAERGVYIGLLASAWESPEQGTLPASADKVRRLAEMSLEEWAESGEVLLEKFPLSACGTFRYNPRLLAEADKERARSLKAKASADKRWQSERNANASNTDANAPEKPCERNAIVKLSKVKKEDKSSSTALRSTRAPKPEPEHFADFWQAYPRKVAKPQALKAFSKLSPDECAAAAGWARDWFARRTDWINADTAADYRPYPATWLNDRRWTELAEPVIIPITSATGHYGPNYQQQRTTGGIALCNDDRRNVALDFTRELSQVAAATRHTVSAGVLGTLPNKQF
ncbi:DUF1376 domain-containing protein [Hymenobacter lapidiphilus]|uniref:DUF1376 domain-containing protein n=1 Tax=Hymenobacter lapidiphilus TaxID=2608003 RepID=A0A7Y7PTQ2_9BACT|nr:DUF1376 domain-containing protein [Hymenobacter lapidiphilus]NVO33482.1 DUF1376 domain-containing protein [Hymenobacter lapidiphilus]